MKCFQNWEYTASEWQPVDVQGPSFLRGGLRKIDHVHEKDTECHPEANNTKRRSTHFSSQGRGHLTKVYSDPNNLEMPNDLLFLNYQPPWLV